MNRLVAVICREYLERVRSKAFVVGTIAAPLMMAAFMLLPLYFAQHGGQALRIAVVDDGSGLGAEVERSLLEMQQDGRAQFTVERASMAEREALERRVREGALDGYLHLPPMTADRFEPEYRGKNVSNDMDLDDVERAIEDARRGRLLTDAGLSRPAIEDLSRRLRLKKMQLTATGAREERGASTLVAVLLMVMLYTTVVMWGQATMTSVLEEKTSRVVEILVSHLSPAQLFAGKLIGVGAVGLTQYGAWFVAMVVLGSVSGSIGLASEGAKALAGMGWLVPLSFIAFFVLGYLLYAALFAAVGASVNTPQEAQSLVFPVFAPLILSMMAFPAVLRSPDGPVSVTLSMIPFMTPLLMFLRIAIATPPLWQIALSMILTAATVAGVVLLASRIYRVGILMYGKRPTFPEILRWVRAR